MSGLSDFRQQHPEYNDLSDIVLADKLHDKFYPDMPKEQYYAKLGVKEPGFLSSITSAAKSLASPFVGAAEAGANMVTGMIAKPVSDVAGLAALGKEMVSPTPGGGDPAGFKNSVQQAMTYEPKTDSGKLVAEYNPVALAGRAVGAVGNAAGDLVGGNAPADSVRGMAGNAVREAVPQAATILGAKYGGKLKAEINPDIKPPVQTLLDEGVSLTPGQIKGGALQRIEDGATSIPLIGDVVKNAKRRSIESFNEAAINRALAPIGEKLPKGLKGYDAIEHTQVKLGDAYEKLLPNLKGSLDEIAPNKTVTPNAVVKLGNKVVPTLRQELETIRDMGKAGLPAEQASQLSAIIDKEVLGQFTEHGLASGETLKNIESRLGSLSRDYANVKGNYHVEQLGDAVQEVQASLRRMVDRVNPDYRGELSKVNSGYANFKRVQRAAGSVGSKDGEFSAPQLANAVRALDRTKDKSASAKGQALMQDLSSAGKQVLPTTVPDSGTPFRGAVIAAATHPIKAAALAIPATMLSLAYTPWGQAAAKSLLTSRIKLQVPKEAAAAVSSTIPSEAERARRKKERAAKGQSDE